MRKGIKLFFAIFVFILIGCKKQPTALPDSQTLVEQAKQAAENIIGGNVTKEVIKTAEQTTQVILVPSPQSQGQSIISDYQAPCLLKDYRVLNVYCKSKNFWHNQSTLLSWYIPYSVILLLLAIALFLIWLWRRNH